MEGFPPTFDGEWSRCQGFMEGAVDAAQRVVKEVSQSLAAASLGAWGQLERAKNVGFRMIIDGVYNGLRGFWLIMMINDGGEYW